MKNDIMYTIDGQAVSIYRKVEEGWLGCYVLDMDYDQEEEYIDDEFIISDQIILHTRLFDKAPTLKLDDQVKELKNKKASLKEEIKNLKLQKDCEEGLLKSVSKYPVLQELADYLNGDFQFVVYVENLDIQEKRYIHKTNYVRTARIGKDTDFSIYLMRSENYVDSQDSRIRVFKTQEDALEYGVNKFIKYINDFDSKNYYQNRPVEFFNDLYKNLDPKGLLKTDERISKAYNDKLKIVQAEQDKRTQEQIDKKLAEIEAEKEKLLNQKQ